MITKLITYTLILLFLFSCTELKISSQTPKTKKIFSYNSQYPWVLEVRNCANNIANDKGFQKELAAKKSFDYTDDNGLKVLDKMLSKKCVIRTYKTRNPWSSVYATTFRTNRRDLYLNRRKTRSISSWVGTSHHECSHLYGYSHGDNSRAGKGNSVPYWIGALATRYAKKICK